MNKRRINKRTRIAIWATLLCVWCIFIYMMSAKVAADSDEMSLGVVSLLFSIFYPNYNGLDLATQVELTGAFNHFVRKSAHFLEFALLGCLFFQLIATCKTRTLRDLFENTKIAPIAAVSWLCATLYAATDEIHQLFVPGRAGMIQDVALDSCGVLTGVALLVLAHYILWRRRSKRLGASSNAMIDVQ